MCSRAGEPRGLLASQGTWFQQPQDGAWATHSTLGPRKGSPRKRGQGRPRRTSGHQEGDAAGWHGAGFSTLGWLDLCPLGLQRGPQVALGSRSSGRRCVPEDVRGSLGAGRGRMAGEEKLRVRSWDVLLSPSRDPAPITASAGRPDAKEVDSGGTYESACRRPPVPPACPAPSRCHCPHSAEEARAREAPDVPEATQLDVHDVGLAPTHRGPGAHAHGLRATRAQEPEGHQPWAYGLLSCSPPRHRDTTSLYPKGSELVQLLHPENQSWRRQAGGGLTPTPCISVLGSQTSGPQSPPVSNGRTVLLSSPGAGLGGAEASEGR